MAFVNRANSDKKNALDAVVKQYIELVLRANNGNRTQSAKELGIDRRTLGRYISSRGINVPSRRSLAEGLATMKQGKAWLITYTGKRIYIEEPDPQLIDIEDIAHSLAMLCRFQGHCLDFYSVAQHSVFVSRIVPIGYEKVGLLHDATEAYVGDMIGPLKRVIGIPYKKIELMWWDAIAEKFNLPREIPEPVSHADVVALLTERRDIVAPHQHMWTLKNSTLDPHPTQITALMPWEARAQFINRYKELFT